jgi:voltage-gated potassium channel
VPVGEQTHCSGEAKASAAASAAGATTPAPVPRLRRRLYEILEAGQGIDPVSRVDAFIVALILLNVAAFVAETVPRLAQEYGAWFRTFEFVSVAVFTVEYVLRLWVAVEVPFLSRLPAWKARLTFASRGPQIIDLLAILPFYLGELLAIDLRVLRVLRLLRFLKLSRYSPAMHALIRVLHAERRALVGALLLLCAAVLFASTGIYYLESQAQPDKFGSVPDAAWWAIATLTTVGYGDVTPVTPLGRLFGSLVMVLGLCILALPVAIISTGFAQEASRRDFVVTWSLVSRVPLLAELDARDVARIMPLLQAHNLPPNVEIVPAGSPGAAMYFIAAGKVRARAAEGDQEYATGDFFGDVAMVENELNRASYVTCAKCRLLKLHKEDFAQLEAASPTIARHIREVAAARFARQSG